MRHQCDAARNGKPETLRAENSKNRNDKSYKRETLSTKVIHARNGKHVTKSVKTKIRKKGIQKW